MKSWKVLGATILTVLGLALAPLFNASAVTYQIDAKQLVDEATAARGDTLTYTISITNVGDATINPIFISETLSPYVDYVAGSTAWSDSLGGGAPVTDAWLTDGLNLGVLNQTEWVKVTFKAKIKADAPKDGLVESVAQIKKTWKVDEEDNPVNEWFQCAAQTTITVPAEPKKPGEVLAAEVLPDTGAEDVLAVSLYLGYLGFLVRRIKLTKYL
jgi:uncharacterized repeat protein (TIGR01451 family)